MDGALWRNGYGNMGKPSKWWGAVRKKVIIKLILPLAELCPHILPCEFMCGWTSSLHVRVPSAALQKASSSWLPPGARVVCAEVWTLLEERAPEKTP